MITFIVPAYNAQQTIAKCLGSILSQKIEKQVIVIDNNSSDSTAAIIKKYPVQYAYEPNRNLASVRNKGLELVSDKSDYVAFIDADVVIPDSNWAQRAIAILHGNDHIAGVGGGALSLKKGRISRMLDYLFFGHKKTDKLSSVKCIATMNAVYKKNIVCKIKFDTRYHTAAEDIDFNFKIIKKGYYVMFSNDLWVYHNHPMTLGKLCIKWFKYGKYYMLPYVRNSILDISFLLHMLYAILLIVLIILSLFDFSLLLYVLLSLLIIPLMYTILGLGVVKFTEYPLFVFVHTIKRLSHLLGIYIGLAHLIFTRK